MGSKPKTVYLHGGPLDGKSAPNGPGAYPPQLDLLYASDPPNALLRPDALVDVSMCHYVHRKRGIYDFSLAQTRKVVNGEYLALKSAEKVYDRLRALVTDPRLLESLDSSALLPEDALPLPDALRMKARATPVFRQWLKEQGESVAHLTDEQIWERLAGRLQTELEWADIGLMPALDEFRHNVYHLFGIELHQRLGK